MIYFCSCQCCCWLQSLTSKKNMVLRQVAQGFPCKYQNSYPISDHLQRKSSPGGLLGRQADTNNWPYWHEHLTEKAPKGPESGSQLMSRRSLSFFKFEFNCGLSFTFNLEYVIMLKCHIVKTVIFIFSVSTNDINSISIIFQSTMYQNFSFSFMYVLGIFRSIVMTHLFKTSW